MSTMTDGMIAGYCVLTVVVAAASLGAAAFRDEHKKSVWPAFVPLVVWIAPALTKLWLALVLG